MFFELSNNLNNMKDISLINTDYTLYTAVSFDMILDGGSNNYYCFVVTKPLDETTLDKLTIN